jgi:RimJ/RimL family protein N-acetyltransferase
MKYFKKIAGKDVYLSPVCADDAEQYARWLSDPEVTDLLGTSHEVITVLCEKDWIHNNIKDNKSYFFGIVKHKNDELIGNIGFLEIEHVHRTATLGIFIGDSKNCGKGYGTQAMKLAVKYGFDVLNLNNIDLSVFDFNERAVKSYIKAGFKEYGRRRQAFYINGKYHDAVRMDILREDFYSGLL